MSRQTDEDGHALITDSEVDAIIIASHDSTHYEYAMAAVAAGKPTLCEKPLAPSLAECEEIVAAEAAAGGRGRLAGRSRHQQGA